MKPFDKMCQLKGNLTADDYLEYDGLSNVSMNLKNVYVCAGSL